MNIQLHQFRHGIQENRLICLKEDKGGLSNVPEVSPESFDMEKFKEWRKDTPGAQEMFDAFSEGPDVTKEELYNYLMFREGLVQKDSKNEEMRPFENTLIQQYAILQSPKNPEARINAEKEIQKVVSYINSRKNAVTEAKKSRGDFRKEAELPTVTGGVVNTAKSMVGASVEGFKNANGQDKMLMLAGLAASVLIIRAIWKSSSESSTGKAAKKALGLALGVGVSVMAFEAVNRSVEKVRGKPLISWKDGKMPEVPLGGLATGDKTWEKQKRDALIEKAYEELKDLDVPVAFLDQMGFGPDSKKYMLGVSNISGLSVMEFGNLYEMYKGTKTIPKNAPGYPMSKSKDDLLTPSERFSLVEDIGKTLGMVDDKGNFVPPADPNRAEQTMFYLMIDWEAASETAKAKEEKPKEEETEAEPDTPSEGGDASFIV